MPISGPDILIYEKKDRVVTMTINRPERLNAISMELAYRMEEAWVKFRDDDDAWVAVVTGRRQSFLYRVRSYRPGGA